MRYTKRSKRPLGGAFLSDLDIVSAFALRTAQLYLDRECVVLDLHRLAYCVQWLSPWGS